MKKNIYRLFVVIIFSVLIVSCGSSGGDDGGVANAAPVNTDCVLGASKIGDCTI